MVELNNMYDTDCSLSVDLNLVSAHQVLEKNHRYDFGQGYIFIGTSYGVHRRIELYIY